MKRDNFVLVCVYSASDLNDESHYSVKLEVLHVLYLRCHSVETTSGHLGLNVQAVLSGIQVSTS